MDRVPACRHRPLAADRFLPSGVLGPVERVQGLFAITAARKRWRPCMVNLPRFNRLRFPAATRRGLGDEVGWLFMCNRLNVVTS